MNWDALQKRLVAAVTEIEKCERQEVLLPPDNGVTGALFKEETCWHCHGYRVCICEGCDSSLDQSSGQCRACRGLGYLSWGVIIH